MNLSNLNETLYISIKTWLSSSMKPHGIMTLSEVNAALGTTVGEYRTENQDRVAVGRFVNPGDSQPVVFALLCDGVGGMADGAECAEIALSAMVSAIFSSGRRIDVRSLQDCIQAANWMVHEKYRGKGGTTMVGAIFSAQGNYGCSVGDSRLYSYFGNQLLQISLDDTIAGELSRIKGTQQGEAADGILNHLAQYMGIGDGLEPRVYLLPEATDDGYYALTSDGVHSLYQPLFESIFRNAPSMQTIITRHIQLSRWRGANDNASMVCISPIRAGRKSAQAHEVLELWDSQSKLEVISLPERGRMHSLDEQKLKPSQPYEAVKPDPRKSSRKKKTDKTGGGSRSRSTRQQSKDKPLLEIEVDTPESADSNLQASPSKTLFVDLAGEAIESPAKSRTQVSPIVNDNDAPIAEEQRPDDSTSDEPKAAALPSMSESVNELRPSTPTDPIGHKSPALSDWEKTKKF